MAESYSYLCWMVLEWFNLKPYPQLYVLSSFSSDQAADLYSFDKGGSGFSPKSYSLRFLLISWFSSVTMTALKGYHLLQQLKAFVFQGLVPFG